MKPDFLVIGAEKAGTTWLYEVLRSHPQIFLPDAKELHFFNSMDSNGRRNDRFENGLVWYENHFATAPKGAICGEATPMYLCDPLAPSRIHQLCPSARLIVILRNPISRAWSHFRMARAKGHITESLDRLIAEQDPRILGRGLYARQLAHWFALFPRNQFSIHFFEDIVSRPRPTLSRIASWLNVDPEPLMSANLQGRRNAATGYRSASLYNASVYGARALRDFRLTRALAGGMKAAGFYDVVKRANRAPPPNLVLTSAQHAALREFYSADVARLTQVYGLHPPWSEEFGTCANPVAMAV